MSQAPNDSIPVAVLTPRLPPSGGIGGIATAHFNLFSALSKAGWHVKAFAYQDSQEIESATELRCRQSKALAAGIQGVCKAALAVLSPRRQSYQLADTLSGAIAGLGIGRSLARFRPRIIIAPDKGAPLAFVAKPPGARLIWISHNNPMRFLGMHAVPPLSALDARLAVRIEQRALKKADLVLCPSRHMREQFLETYRFGGRIEVVPHLISDAVAAAAPATPTLRQMLRLSGNAPLFYLPGAGTSVKGGKYLAPLLSEIGRRHAEAGVFLSGHLENSHLAAPAGAPANVRVFSPGPLPYAENLARVRECDVALSPALFESFGMALLEAAWLGVPAAAFSVGGIPDLIGRTDGGSNGEIVPAGDIASLCDAGDALLGKLRGGELTRAQVSEYTRTRFSTARTLGQIETLIYSLLEKAPQPGRQA